MLRDGQGVVANPCQTGLTLRSLGRRRDVSGQRSFAAIIAMPLSERGKCSYRTARTDYCFRAHFNLWWTRHGWPLIHLVSRRNSVFSRPPYFTAGVNLTAESAIEPPRGGEHGAGETCLNKKTSIRGIPKLIQIIACVSHKQLQKKTPLTLRANQRRKKAIDASYI